MAIPIPNVYFIILLAILTGYLTFLTAKGGLTDNRHNGYWRRLTKRGREVFFILLTIAVVLVLQELNNQLRGKDSERKLKAEQSKRDSLVTDGINRGVDSSRRKLFDDISKAFLKQELKLDTVNKEVVRIRDSSLGIVNNFIQKEDPILMIDSAGIKLQSQNDQKKTYLISFKSSDAASTNFDVSCYLVTPVGERNFEVARGDIFPKELQIPKNGAWSTDFTLEREPYAHELYINLVGKYSNLDRTKFFPVNNVYVFDIEKNSVKTLIGTERQKVLNIIKRDKNNRNAH